MKDLIFDEHNENSGELNAFAGDIINYYSYNESNFMKTMDVYDDFIEIIFTCYVHRVTNNMRTLINDEIKKLITFLKRYTYYDISKIMYNEYNISFHGVEFKLIFMVETF